MDPEQSKTAAETFLTGVAGMATPVMQLSATAAGVCVSVALMWAGYRVLSRLFREASRIK